MNPKLPRTIIIEYGFTLNTYFETDIKIEAMLKALDLGKKLTSFVSFKLLVFKLYIPKSKFVKYYVLNSLFKREK